MRQGSVRHLISHSSSGWPDRRDLGRLSDPAQLDRSGHLDCLHRCIIRRRRPANRSERAVGGSREFSQGQGSPRPAAKQAAAWPWALSMPLTLKPPLGGYRAGALRGALRAIILLVLARRIVLMRGRGKFTRPWVPLSVVMVLAVPLWLLIEGPHLRRGFADLDCLRRSGQAYS